ncbi:MAG: adenine deaminase [Chloroflexi bacterium]|nr:adenine deaminase [Chloroflexota bacterium]
MPVDLKRLIPVARGLAPADLVLTNARILNTFTGEITPGAIAITQGRVAGIGPSYVAGKRTIDLGGRYVAPGLIDGHVHPESSYLSPVQYARAVVPRGTTAIVTDLHEVTNVSGLPGLRYYMNASRRTPLDVYFMAPSCVPCSPLETSGAVLNADELRQAMRWSRVLGIGEMMNFPGVLNGDPDVLAKIEAAHAMGKLVDGHAPHLRGADLQGYLSAGISSDHECTDADEAREKMALGMRIMIREGSSEKNLEELLPIVTDKTYPRAMLVVDDRTCLDITRDGDVDAVVRKAIRLGMDPVRAVTLATLNTALYFGLPQRGAVAPGYHADLLVLDDLTNFSVQMVFKAGKLVAQEGKALFRATDLDAAAVLDTIRMLPVREDALALASTLDPFPVIDVVPGQIVTRRADLAPLRENGHIVADTERDLLKIVVAERHHRTGNIGRALIRGFGLKRGAIASTVAHDSHNIMVVGTNDRDIAAAINEIERLRGGLCVVENGQVLESLPLPLAGLLSDEPLEFAAGKLAKLEALARERGCELQSPFATLSFMALPVIPALKLTDRGLVDVTRFEIIA